MIFLAIVNNRPEMLTLKDSEEELVRRALSDSAWNKSEAARQLGVDRKRLYRMIRKYRIAKSEVAEVTAGGASW